jgi:hypothetical protein
MKPIYRVEEVAGMLPTDVAEKYLANCKRLKVLWVSGYYIGDIIDNSFIWCDSTEGDEYWRNLSESYSEVQINIPTSNRKDVVTVEEVSKLLPPRVGKKYLHNCKVVGKTTVKDNTLGNIIAFSFEWGSTDQGYNYWEKVSRKFANTYRDGRER